MRRTVVKGSGKMRIVVLQRGWIVQGIYKKQGDGFVIQNGFVIRKWGTDNGLGELAFKGPTENRTVLDPITELYVHKLAVVFTLECTCDDRLWAAHKNSVPVR